MRWLLEFVSISFFWRRKKKKKAFATWKLENTLVE